MTVKKKTTKLTDATTISKEVPYFLKREAIPSTQVGGTDYVIFPDSMPLVDSIVGSEPIMVQSSESEDPKTITPNQLKSWLTGRIGSGNDGFIMGADIFKALNGFVPTSRTINNKPLDRDLVLSKEDIGLGNVDNTSDLDKPISNAVQTALDELKGDLAGDYSDLANQIKELDVTVDEHDTELTRITPILEGLDEDFTDHINNKRPHEDAMVKSAMEFFGKWEYVPQTPPDIYPIPSLTFLREYAEAWLPQASVKDTLDGIYGEGRGDTYLTGYTENFDPNLVPLRKISLKELKTYIDSKAAGVGLKNLPSTIVGSSMDKPITSSASWPNLGSQITDESGYLVYVGGIPLNTPDAVSKLHFAPIRNPHDNVNYPPYSVLLYKGGTYTILGLWRSPIGGSLITTDSDGNTLTDKMLLRLITQDTMQYGIPGYEIDIPYASSSASGLLKAADFNRFLSIIPFDRGGTPNDSWTIGKDGDHPLTISREMVDPEEYGNVTPTSNNLVTFEDGTDNDPGIRVGDLIITGNVVQKGESFISEAEQVMVKDNMLTLNAGEVGAGVTAGISGLEIDRGTLPKYQIIFDESDKRFKAGEVGDLRNLMLRDTDEKMEMGTIQGGNILFWDQTSKIAKASVMAVHDILTLSQVQGLLDDYFPKTGGVINGSVTLGLPNATDYRFYRVRRGGYTGELSVADGRTNILATRDSDSVRGSLSIGLADITFNGKSLALAENVPAPITNYAGSSSTGGAANSAVDLVDGGGGTIPIQVQYTGTGLTDTTAKYLAAWKLDTVNGKRILRDITADGARALIGAAPTSHTHTKSQITDFPTTWAWSNISGKPSTFTPSSHTHTKSQISDFPNNLVTTDGTQTISGSKTFSAYTVFSNGAGTASTSDMRFKRVIREFNPEECLDWVSKSPGFEYEWKGGFQNIGTSAQYWEKLLDKLVVHMEDKNNTLAFSYERYTIILQEAIKALLKRVQTLENVINNE